MRGPVFVLAMLVAACADTSDGRWPVQVLGDRPMGLWGPKTPARNAAFCTPLRAALDSLPSLKGAPPIPGFQCETMVYEEGVPQYWCDGARGPAEGRRVMQEVRSCFPTVEVSVGESGTLWRWHVAARRVVTVSQEDADDEVLLFIAPHEFD